MQATTSRAQDSARDFRVMSLKRMIGDAGFRRGLDDVADEISNRSKTALNEATVISNFERILYGFMKSVTGFDFVTEREISVEVINNNRRVVKGRIDSRIGALVIEYKHSSKLATKGKKAEALQQISGYLDSCWRSTGKSLVGIVTDGVQAQTVQVDSDGVLTHSAFEPLHRGHLERVIISAVLLGQTALTPENLVADFCQKREVAFDLARALFNSLQDGEITERSSMLFAEWRTLFHLAHDDISKQGPIRERKKALGQIFEFDAATANNDTEYRALYALQTAYAIIVKSIALNVLASIRDHSDLIDFKRHAEANSETLRAKLARIEEGDLLRSLGFTNLLEGDFFAWYCTPEQWRDDPVGKSVRTVFAVLSGYEEQPFLNATETAVDFFKDLYTAIMPDKVRHSLGEYYTPPWLADLVVDRALELAPPREAWRGIDTCCGSGTFVTTMLRKKLYETRSLSERDRLAEVITCVKGIDLNPLAVLTARINYFINISSLLQEEDEVEIPVYLGDASYVPETVRIGNVTCFRYQISTLANPWPEGEAPEGSGSFIDVVIPASGLKNLRRFSEAMAKVERHIKNLDGVSIVEELSSICDPADLSLEVTAALQSLAKQFVTLEQRKWNGIWARIVTDFLTTAALGRFDIIVGNPPWIDWRNLPSSYRDRIKGLCLDRSLFSGDGITGGINLNVCALITNVAADNWLSADGVLAFLMPDSLLVQSTYKGFRELRTLKGLGFLELHDWSYGGKPFAPVGQNFYAYFLGPKEKAARSIPVKRYVKKPNDRDAIPPALPLADYRRVVDFADVEHAFETICGTAEPISGDPRNGFLVQVAGAAALPDGIADSGDYTARQGLEFFPKPVFMMKFERRIPPSAATFSKLDSPADRHVIETEFMFPMIQGARISKFAPPEASAYVPFAYDEGKRSPYPVLKSSSP